MYPKPSIAVPDAQPLRQVLAGCEPLLRLQQRLAQSQQRLDVVRPLLPPGLRPFVKSGPVEDESWTLLASGPAIAAKLRQLLPAMEDRLRLLGLSPSTIRIRVQAQTTAPPR